MKRARTSRDMISHDCWLDDVDLRILLELGLYEPWTDREKMTFWMKLAHVQPIEGFWS
jgi:hypothetical protein